MICSRTILSSKEIPHLLLFQRTILAPGQNDVNTLGAGWLKSHKTKSLSAFNPRALEEYEECLLTSREAFQHFKKKMLKKKIDGSAVWRGMVIAFTWFDCYSETHSHLFYSSDNYKVHPQMKTGFSHVISDRASSLTGYLSVISCDPQTGLLPLQ